MTWLGFVALLKRVPPAVWVALALIAALLMFGHVQREVGRQEVQAKFDAYRGKLIAATAIAVQAARAKEAQDRARFAEIGSNFLEAKDEARGKELAVAAAVRSERLRLRKQWVCPAAGVPGVAGSAGAADAGTELRAAAAGRIVRIGAEADAQVNGLQALLRAERMRPIER